MLKDFTANRESRVVMEDRLWRLYFKRAVEQKERSVISLIPIVDQCDGGANKTNMIAAIMWDQSCSEPTARKMLDRYQDRGLIAYVRDQTNGTRILYSIPGDVQQSLRVIEELTPIIVAVTVAQKAAPDDFMAGESLLPDHAKTIYFNARNPRNVRVLQSQIVAKVKAIKESKKCLEIA